MKNKSILFQLVVLIIGITLFTSCGDDGEGSPGTFGFSVYNGETKIALGTDETIEGATVEVYSSLEAWASGETSLGTFATGADGFIETNDIFPTTAVVYAESGSFNNYPNINTLSADANIENRLNGSAYVYRTLLSDFQNVSNKKYLLTDVLLNGNSTFNVINDCSKDNTIQLHLDKTFTYSEGSNICDGQSASTEYDLLNIPYSTSQADESIVNGEQCYAVLTTWDNIQIHIQQDFNKVYTKISTTDGELISVYSLQ